MMMDGSGSPLPLPPPAPAPATHDAPGTITPQLLEGSEAGRRFMLDYLHRREATRTQQQQQQQDDDEWDIRSGGGGGVEMTPAVLKAAALAHEGGYETPALNDRLYLHYRGFRRLSRHLAAYSGLKALWLDSNGLASLSCNAPGSDSPDSDSDEGEDEGHGGGGGHAGLRALSQLRCLYLQNNLLTRLGTNGLRGLDALVTLDISHNRLTRLEGLSHLPCLRTLNAARNYLRDDDESDEDGSKNNNEEEDGNEADEATGGRKKKSGSGKSSSIAHLALCAALTNVDLSHNQLGDFDRSVTGALARAPALLSLNLAGNPVVSTPQFRKRAVVAMPRLRYLDRPVFEAERLAAEAWAEGGPAAEQAARAAWKRREEEAHAAGLQAYREWARRVRGAGAAPEPAVAVAVAVVPSSEEDEDGALPPLVGGDGEEEEDEDEEEEDGNGADEKAGAAGGDEGPKQEDEEEKEEEEGMGCGVSALKGASPPSSSSSSSFLPPSSLMEELD